MIVKVNEDFLRRVREEIVKNSKHFRYSTWFADPKAKSPKTFGEYLHTCGTMACVGGYAIALAYPDREYDAGGERYLASKLIFSDDQPLEAKEYGTQFLLIPWRAHGAAETKGMYNVPQEDQIAEALRRIDWLLDGNDIYDYVVPQESGLRTEWGTYPD